MKNWIAIIFICATYNLSAQPFFPIKVNNLWGAIDSTGKIVLEPTFSGRIYVHGDNNELLVHYNEDTVTIINSRLKVISSLTSVGTVLYRGEGVFQYRKDTVKYFGLYGLIDTTGQIITPPKFELIYEFNEGLALVKYCIGYNGKKKNIKMGMIDRFGNWIIQPTFADGKLEKCSDGLIRFRNDEGKWGAMNKSGEIIIQPKYSYLGDCVNGFMEYSISDLSYRSGIITKDEKVVIPDDGKTSILYQPCCSSDTLIVVSSIEGNSTFNPQLSNYSVFTLHGKKLFSSNHYGLGRLCLGVIGTYGKNNKYGLIDVTGNEIVPLEYSHIYTGTYPLLLVLGLNSKFGFISYKGKEITPCIYDDASPFKNGLACLYKGGKSYECGSDPEIEMGYINSKGEFVWHLTK